MFKFKKQQDQIITDLPNNGKQVKFNYDLADVKLLKYPKGSQIPKHSHVKESLHIILKGKIKLFDKDITLSEMDEYACGGVEYGPWLVNENVEMLVITPK
jgi:hypothetical protein